MLQRQENVSIFLFQILKLKNIYFGKNVSNYKKKFIVS